MQPTLNHLVIVLNADRVACNKDLEVFSDGTPEHQFYANQARTRIRYIDRLLNFVATGEAD